LLECIINGLTIGSIYVLISLGLTLTFTVFKVPYFAHAPVVMFGAFFTYFLCRLYHFNFWLAMVVSACGCALIAAAMERFLFRQFLERHPLEIFTIIFGAYMLMENLALVVWGIYPKVIPPFATYAFQVGTIYINLERIVIILTGFFVIILLHLFVKKTKLGKAIRATSQDMFTASVLGVNIDRIRSLTFALSGALGAVAGSFLGVLYSVNPYLADYIIVKAFIAVILGGFGSIIGTIIGGYVVGLSESLVATYISSEFKDILAFVLAIIILMVKPSGFITVKERK